MCLRRDEEKNTFKDHSLECSKLSDRCMCECVCVYLPFNNYENLII